MWIKNILKAFDKETKIKYYINNTLIEDIETVEQFMNNGLTTYSECKEGELKIEDNTIIIRR